jgi:hypothetical protein
MCNYKFKKIFIKFTHFIFPSAAGSYPKMKLVDLTYIYYY